MTHSGVMYRGVTYRGVTYRGVTYRGVTSVAPVLSCDGEICPGSEELVELHFSINSTNCVLKMRQRQQEPVDQAAA